MHTKSIFGTWWEPIRKWFYPIWLIYELSVRFYAYSADAYSYFSGHQGYFYSLLGHTGAQLLAISVGMATFIICTFFLTIPSVYILYQFFKDENLTGTAFEGKMKFYF
ncbi:hypothetical protein QWY31_10335 [Cytophagales bacterium LB-30]|uniref:Uncharacterized protein n=1 Tax=Shiella aurantiaca TaxID=3058365 RepID=A0ABT8F631_9BACT|nr:hypothetical protein [Shiella aurantiaca]MDN4165902.1 hypothetical protein [Shiella aurantiaca]